MVPLLPPVRGLDVFPRPPVDGIRVGDEVIQEHAEAVDVRRLRARLSLEDFRCEIQRRPGEIVHRSGMPAAAIEVEVLAGAEVHQHRPSALFAHDVVRFDVAVQQAGAVHRCQRAAQVQTDQRGFTRAEGAMRPKKLGERASLDELHPESDAAADVIRPVNGRHVGMADPRQQPRFFERTRRIGGGTPVARAASARLRAAACRLAPGRPLQTRLRRASRESPDHPRFEGPRPARGGGRVPSARWADGSVGDHDSAAGAPSSAPRRGFGAPVKRGDLIEQPQLAEDFRVVFRGRRVATSGQSIPAPSEIAAATDSSAASLGSDT